MQPRDKTFHHGPRQQFHILDADQYLGIDESILGPVNCWSVQSFLVLHS